MASAKFYGTGRRKKSIARVYLTPGTGKITINKRDVRNFFKQETNLYVVNQPLNLVKLAEKFDFVIKGDKLTLNEGNDDVVLSRVK